MASLVEMIDDLRKAWKVELDSAPNGDAIVRLHDKEAGANGDKMVFSYCGPILYRVVSRAWAGQPPDF